MPQVRVGLERHRAEVVVAAPGAFVFRAGDGQTAEGAAQTWTVYLRTAVPAGTPSDGRGEVYVAAADGAGRWQALPLRLRSTDEQPLLAGADAERLRPYEGEIEVARDAAGRLCLINVVDLEAYTRGVVSAEMNPSFPAAALQAQAVAARSVALTRQGRHRADGYDLCAEPHCQAYRGLAGQTPDTIAAVEATRGQVLTYNREVASVVYHAVCGGHTDSASDIWGGADVPYLRGAPDRDAPANPSSGYRQEDERLRAYLKAAPAVNCRQADCDLTRFRWVRVLRRQEVERNLAEMINVGEVTDLRPLQRGASGRITRLEVVGTRGASVIAPELVIRHALGGLPSSAFVVDRYCDDEGRAVVFVLWGAGHGHGVGMCQVGAVGLARQGRDYRALLSKYYPGTEIETLY